MTRFLIMLEQTEQGFAVQVPDLAIVTCGENIDVAKRAATEAIQTNLETYRDAAQHVLEEQDVSETSGESLSFGIYCLRTSRSWSRRVGAPRLSYLG